MVRQSLAQFLDKFLLRGEETAYVQPRGYRTERWTYRQVAEAGFRFARELEARAIAKGDRVLLWGPNSAEWVEVFLGCALRGVVVVPIDDVAAPDFALRVHQQVGARLLVSSREHVMPDAPAVILEEIAPTLASHSSAPYPANDIQAYDNDTLEVVFTSGTTAEPKGVVITHANVLANIAPLEAEMQKYLRYERFVHPLRFLNLLPLSHVFGQFLGIFLPPLLGATVIFQQKLKPGEVMATIRRERASVLVAVPRMLQALKEKVERDLEDECATEKFRRKFQGAEGKHFLRRWWIFRRLRRQLGWKFWAFICGGATLDRETEEFWGRLGYAVIQGYGLTETTSLVSVNHPFHLGKGSIGKVLAGREVKLADDGEIVVRGGGVAGAYWGAQSSQPVTSDEGWYRTGDVGELDSEGNLYFKGRKKDVIVTAAGMKVYPEDLEAALRRMPEIRDVLVIPVPRDGNAEPCAVMMLREGSGSADGIVARANQSLAEYQRMYDWFVWPEDDFPRTATGKPRRSVIQQTVLAGIEQSRSEIASSSPLAELIERVTGRRPAELSVNDDLDADLRLSSLDRVALMGALEDRYQLDLSETRFASVNTVADLQKLLHGEAGPRVHYHYPRWVLRWPVTWIRLAVHYLLLRPAVFLLGWPRVEGRENLHHVSGPVLVVCNHVGDVDPGFVLTALPARLRHRLAVATGGEALEALRTPPVGRNAVGKAYDRLRWTLGVSLLNLFPLPREAGFRESFAYAGEAVDLGYSVLVFPEGHHTVDGAIRRFRSGIGLLANNLQIPIVPMRIHGLFERKQMGKKFAWPGQIRVKIGAVIPFVSHVSKTAPDPEGIARELQKRVEAL